MTLTNKEATYRYPDAIVTGAWLADHLDDPDLRIFECTMYLQYDPSGETAVTARNARPEYDAGHIPGAGYLDLQDDLSDTAAGIRFKMPTAEALAKVLGEKGVDDATRVVLYSRDTLQWSTRVWWMFRAMGFDNVAILDGGWHSWVAEGRLQSTAPSSYPAGTVTAKPRPSAFVGKDQVRATIGDGAVCTINALTADIHSGADGRYGRPGRIPGSVNVPAASLQEPKMMKLTSPDEAQAAFDAVGADRAAPVIVYCGGGVAATLDAFLMHQLGYENIAVYDNSMTEWANDPDLPMEVD